MVNCKNKIIYMILICLSLIIGGCSTHQNQTLSSTTDTKTETTPVINESQSVSLEANSPSPSPSTESKNEFIYSLDDQDIVFYFDMPMDEALEALEQAGIEYETRDDSSPFRSWSGYYVTTNKSFSLVFDLTESKLHEIEISSSLGFSLPINVWDSYKDMIASLGEVEYKEHPTPYAIATHYCEYKMDGYYLRPIFGDEDMAVEDSNISEIILSKYSLDEYKNLIEPATLIFTNKNGDQADFYIGMSVDKVKAQLDTLDLLYSIHNGVMSGFSYDDLPEDGTLPGGFDFDIYFDRNSLVHTIETYGPGILTQLGLKNGDPETKMLELYGENYINVEFYNDYWHNYSYISGDNYLTISTSTELDLSAPVNVLAITRYTETNLKGNSYSGIM